MGSPDLLFNLRNLFYLGAYQAAINNSDVPGLEADAAAERDAIIFRFYIALGSYQLVVSEIDLSAVTSLQAVKLLALYLTGDRVLGTATREEIQCMNRNYTVFGFPHQSSPMAQVHDHPAAEAPGHCGDSRNGQPVRLQLPHTGSCFCIYVVMRLISVIQQGQKQYHLLLLQVLKQCLLIWGISTSCQYNAEKKTQLSVQIAFTCMVYPALILAYMGQAAYLCKHHNMETDYWIGFYVSVPGKLFSSEMQTIA
ncbi:unnamed protein product [Miscanthus lutarioriparius]|uniref:K+ potassium transporter integral membrane domain-containing protein n=1 Tax=Miscanthus lutarioriparius TaxID=422564 RepID=A0A811S096_9POAL|nr:unnamed protein product [Miscanthus lutarioriparius]